MNLPLLRQKANENDIYAFVSKYKSRLLLPDQDILNALYCKEIKKIDELKFNYDTRYYRYNKLLSNGEVDMDYIMHHTSLFISAERRSRGIRITAVSSIPCISIMKHLLFEQKIKICLIIIATLEYSSSSNARKQNISFIN